MIPSFIRPEVAAAVNAQLAAERKAREAAPAGAYEKNVERGRREHETSSTRITKDSVAAAKFASLDPMADDPGHSEAERRDDEVRVVRHDAEAARRRLVSEGLNAHIVGSPSRITAKPE